MKSQRRRSFGVCAANAAVDVWRLDPPHGENPPWWLVETNYDHWKAVPKADDRRDPANE